jgi:hypothetical protein
MESHESCEATVHPTAGRKATSGRSAPVFRRLTPLTKTAPSPIAVRTNPRMCAWTVSNAGTARTLPRSLHQKKHARAFDQHGGREHHACGKFDRQHEGEQGGARLEEAVVREQNEARAGFAGEHAVQLRRHGDMVRVVHQRRERHEEQGAACQDGDNDEERISASADGNGVDSAPLTRGRV